MKTMLVFTLLVLLAACALRPPIDCDGRLEPINVPAKAQKGRAR